MPKHTPRPWLAAAKPSSVVGWPVVAPATGRSICNVTAGHDEAEANALVIAAAPDLLALLTEAVEAIPDWTTGVNRGLIARARAAIAKAEGR